MPVKQVIVMRKDLGMRKGKIAAQAGHAAMKHLLEMFKAGKTMADLNEAQKEWYLNKFRKICVYVNSEQELTEIYNKAIEKGLTAYKVIDSGLTEFDGEATFTCIAIGPHYDEEIDEITKTLPLY